MWTQETLAELSGLTPTTVQRLGAGMPSRLHTRRAVTWVFGLEDTDWLSKPLPIPTGKEIRAQREAFERNHLVLEAKLVDGDGLMATRSTRSATALPPCVFGSCRKALGKPLQRLSTSSPTIWTSWTLRGGWNCSGMKTSLRRWRRR